MGVETIVGAGLGAFGASKASSAAKKSARIAAKGQRESLAESRRQFDTSTELARPSIEAGDTARDQLLALLGIGGDSSGALEQIRNTPGFQFQEEQGTRALNANRSAGGSSGGALLKDFARFNQGLATNFYSDYANRLQNLASGGTATALNQGRNAITQGQIAGNALTGAANARASGVLGAANAQGNFLNDLGGLIGGLNFGGAKNTNSGINTSSLGGVTGAGFNPFKDLF